MSKDLPEDVVTQLRIRQYEVHPRLDRRGRRSTVYVAFLLVIVIIFLFLRDWRVTLVPCVVIPVSLDRGVLRDVRGRLLDQRAVDAGRGAGRRSGRRRRDRDDREHLHPHRAGHDVRRRRVSRERRRSFFAVISTTITLVAVFFPIVFHGGHDRPAVPGVQPGRGGRGAHFGFRGADLHSDAGDQAARCGASGQGWFYRGDRTVLRRDEPPLQPGRWRRSCAGGCVAFPVVLADGGDDLGAVEPDSVRDGAAGGPLDAYTINTRGAGGRSPTSTCATIPRTSTGWSTTLVPEARGRHGPRVERERQRADRAAGHRRPPTARRWRSPRSCRKPSDPRRWPVLSCSSKSTFGGRRGPDARCSTCCRRPISRSSSRYCPEFMAKVYENPDFPDGRRRSEVQQARGPHHDQPRQGRPDGRQHARHRADAAIRAQRPAHGVFLHEREAVRDTRARSTGSSATSRPT